MLKVCMKFKVSFSTLNDVILVMVKIHGKKFLEFADTFVFLLFGQLRKAVNALLKLITYFEI
jgi:hypothetical protein